MDGPGVQSAARSGVKRLPRRAHNPETAGSTPVAATIEGSALASGQGAVASGRSSTTSLPLAGVLGRSFAACRSAASRSRSGMKCPYRVNSMFVDDHPNRFATVTGSGTPGPAAARAG